jgi:alkylation response protein AidB-like acyl-CoA dehydrogenase
MAVPLDQVNRAVRKTARDFAKNELEPIRDEWQRKGEFPHEVYRQMAKYDLRGIMAPEEYGGPGIGMLGHAVAVEEVSKVWPSAGIKMDEGLLRYLRLFGTDEQKAEYIPPICSGELIDAIALSEPDYGSDFAGIQTTAERVDGGYVLNGSKTWITNAGVADMMAVNAKTRPGERHDGISIFLVDPTSDGVEVSAPIEFIGYDASNSHEVVLNDCFVPEENLLGEENRGFYHTMEMLSENRVSVAARALGIADGAFEEARRYATEREAFGQPIAEFQAIRHQLADMAVKVENSRHLVYNAGRRCDEGEPFDYEASLAKLYAAESAHEVASQAVNVHGGYGYTKEFPVQMFYRDAKGIEIYEGTSEIQRNIIAKDILG